MGILAMTVHKWLVGLFLAVIMVLALATNAMLFISRSFQHNLAQLAPASNGILDVQNFLATQANIARIEKSVELQKGEVLRAEQEMKSVQDRAQSIANQASMAGAQLALQVQDLEGRAGIAEPVTTEVDVGALTDRLAAAARAPKLPSTEKATVAALIGEASRVQQLEQDAAQAEADAQAATIRSRGAGSAVADADRQILALKAQLIPDGYEHYETIKSEANALIKGSLFGIGASLVQVHPQFLSMGLILLMGTLGGVLYLFPAYMSRANPVTFAEIAVRMIFGMVTALAFYIVANAAIAGLTFMPGGSNTNMALNPFSVSLIGIVGGIMADDIAKWIHKRGSELLSGGGGSGAGLAQAAPEPMAAPAEPPRGGASSTGGGGYEGGAMGPGASSGAVGLNGGGPDPFHTAAADAARSRVGAATEPLGDQPPRGGVVQR
jgi:hypothetical protein